MVTRKALSELESTPHADVFPNEEPKTVRLSLETSERIPGHRHPGRQVLFYLLEGTVELTLGDETLAVEAGDIVRFDGDQKISPRAATEAEALVVLSNRIQ